MRHFLVSSNSFPLCDYHLKRFRILIFYVAADFKVAYDHNERLEFVGDAMLESVIAKRLFLDFPEMQESTMTLYKIALVREETLCKVAKKI